MRNASKILITSLAMVLSVVGLSASAGETKMTTWTVAAGRFSVAMPAKPTYSSVPVISEADNSVSTSHRYTAETDGGRTAYMVVYADYATGRPSVDGAAKGWAKTGRILKQNTFTFDGLPGIHAVIEAKGSTFDAYAVADGRRLYQVIFGNQAGTSVPAEATEFVRSFKILRSRRAEPHRTAAKTTRRFPGG